MRVDTRFYGHKDKTRVIVKKKTNSGSETLSRVPQVSLVLSVGNQVDLRSETPETENTRLRDIRVTVFLPFDLSVPGLPHRQSSGTRTFLHARHPPLSVTSRVVISVSPLVLSTLRVHGYRFPTTLHRRSLCKTKTKITVLYFGYYYMGLDRGLKPFPDTLLSISCSETRFSLYRNRIEILRPVQ